MSVHQPHPRETSRRDEIVARAVELFDAKGYAGTSVSDIADAVGLSKPALYHYIQRKEDILYWVHGDFTEVSIEKLEARLQEGGPMRGQLQGIVRDLIGLMATHREYIRVFFEHHRELDQERGAEIRASRDRYTGLVRGVIEQGIANGEFRALDPMVTTLSLFGMCNWAYQWFDPSGPLDTDEIADRMVDLVLGGLEAR